MLTRPLPNAAYAALSTFQSAGSSWSLGARSNHRCTLRCWDSLRYMARHGTVHRIDDRSLRFFQYETLRGPGETVQLHFAHEISRIHLGQTQDPDKPLGPGRTATELNQHLTPGVISKTATCCQRRDVWQARSDRGGGTGRSWQLTTKSAASLRRGASESMLPAGGWEGLERVETIGTGQRYPALLLTFWPQQFCESIGADSAGPDPSVGSKSSATAAALRQDLGFAAVSGLLRCQYVGFNWFSWRNLHGIPGIP